MLSQMIRIQVWSMQGKKQMIDEDEWSDDTVGIFDFVTERNIEQNALIAMHVSSRNSSFANLPFIIPA
jgi:hypothetical protein